MSNNPNAAPYFDTIARFFEQLGVGETSTNLVKIGVAPDDRRADVWGYNRATGLYGHESGLIRVYRPVRTDDGSLRMHTGVGFVLTEGGLGFQRHRPDVLTPAPMTGGDDIARRGYRPGMEYPVAPDKVAASIAACLDPAVADFLGLVQPISTAK